MDCEPQYCYPPTKRASTPATEPTAATMIDTMLNIAWLRLAGLSAGSGRPSGPAPPNARPPFEPSCHMTRNAIPGLRIRKAAKIASRWSRAWS